ncbi:hypothetical protein RRF57_001222 [Xylaria bambusicola]|uniref:Uncharacterized protein n=1 Tax=Xylaria bambusicola TaxID=326684 RepID=A0AAN7Z612_9PEZI
MRSKPPRSVFTDDRVPSWIPQVWDETRVRPSDVEHEMNTADADLCQEIGVKSNEKRNERDRRGAI